MAVNLDFATFPIVIVTGCAEAVRTELAVRGDVPGRFCPIIVGPDMPWDECCDGLFYQSISRPLWSQNARQAAEYLGDSNFCGPNYIGFEVQTLILRCVPIVSDQAPYWPDCDPMAAAAVQQQLDMARVRSAIACCLAERLSTYQIEAWQITQQVPQSPQGGCAGSLLTWQVYLPNCDCPGT